MSSNTELHLRRATWIFWTFQIFLESNPQFIAILANAQHQTYVFFKYHSFSFHLNGIQVTNVNFCVLIVTSLTNGLNYELRWLSMFSAFKHNLLKIFDCHHSNGFITIFIITIVLFLHNSKIFSSEWHLMRNAVIKPFTLINKRESRMKRKEVH